MCEFSTTPLFKIQLREALFQTIAAYRYPVHFKHMSEKEIEVFKKNNVNALNEILLRLDGLTGQW